VYSCVRENGPENTVLCFIPEQAVTGCVPIKNCLLITKSALHLRFIKKHLVKKNAKNGSVEKFKKHERSRGFHPAATASPKCDNP